MNSGSTYHIHVTLDWLNVNNNIEWCKEHNMYWYILSSRDQCEFIAVKYTQSDPVLKARNLLGKLKESGLTVCKVIIKSHINDVPVKNILYFEFDIFVSTKSMKDYDNLCVICNTHNATIAYVDKMLTITLKCNIDSDAGGIITEDMSKSLIISKKNIFVSALKLGGFDIYGKIESYAVIYTQINS